MSAFTLEKRDDGIAILTMDVPGETMNTLKGDFGDEISGILDDIENDKNIKGVVVASGKKDSFVAGADVSMLANCK
jgi:3-hydroxyacyl-CoA dehydrogenase/enoyl-CoA hydratase/3-hydroxybutyryl-CoA epimerase